MSIGLWAQEVVFTHVIDVGTGYVQVMHPGYSSPYKGDSARFS